MRRGRRRDADAVGSVLPRRGLGHPDHALCGRAAGIADPAYAIDEETAIKVTAGTSDVVSQEPWRVLLSVTRRSLRPT